MISNFNEETQIILTKAKEEMLELKHPYVGTEHLVLSILKNNKEIATRLEKYNLTYEIFKKEIIKIIGIGSKKSEFFLHTPLLKKVIETAIIDSKENNNNEVTPDHLVSALLDVGEGIAIRIFISLNIDLDSIYDEFSAKIYNNKNKSKKLLIENIGEDLTQKAISGNLDPVIDREEEIKEIEQVLSRRTKNNPLLIGPPGVGKTAIVEELARRIVNNQVSPKLQNKKIISVDMAGAVAGTKYRGEFEERIKKIIDEIKENKNIILFIDEIHTLIGAGGAEGAIDASNIFKPALARGEILCIGATTTEEYKKTFEKDKALDRRFQTIKIEEPSIEKTKNILNKIKPLYEEYHNVILSEKIIDNIINLSEKYIYERFRPDKQIDILDEVCSQASINSYKKNNTIEQELNNIIKTKEEYIKNNNLKEAYTLKLKENNYKKQIKNNKVEVTIEDVANVINQKTSIPIYEILKDNQKMIFSIKRELEKEILLNKETINNIINVTKKIKLGYNDNKCTSIFITGNIGTGKTLLANTYAKLISNKNTIYVDMSEYSDSTSLSKFIGSTPGYIGYDENKYLLNTIKDNPSSVIIFENISKAHIKIKNLINQILETNKVKDSKNNTIKFNNNIIIFTETLQKNNNIGFNNKGINNLKEQIDQNFLNKIDVVIELPKLTQKDLKEIIIKKLENLKSKYHAYNLEFTDYLIKEIINESNYQEYGAKKIDIIIHNKLENIIIDNIINNKKEFQINSLFV